MKAQGLAALGLLSLVPATSVDARPQRVLSLDQCADQYALALAPNAELALSPRADDPDSHLRALAQGRRQVRPTLEAATTFQPDVVIRYWGGDPRLLTALQRRGVKVTSLDDARDFDGVRTNIRRVAQALERHDAGEALVRDMDAKLRRVNTRPAASALYLTAGGFTAGSGTLINAVFRAAGLRNLAPAPGYQPFSVERVVLEPPLRFVLAFFDQARADWRGAGRHPSVRRAAEARTVASLPASLLTCPAWFAADAVERLGKGR